MRQIVFGDLTPGQVEQGIGPLTPGSLVTPPKPAAGPMEIIGKPVTIPGLNVQVPIWVLGGVGLGLIFFLRR